MALRKFSQGADEETEINLSAMIDCIFILLIFFIVTTVFVEESGVQINKPDAAASPSNEESEALTVEITKDDKVLFKGASVTLSQLRNQIANSLEDPETPVSIRSSGEASHGFFIQVWDSVKLAGATQVSFSTVN